MSEKDWDKYCLKILKGEALREYTQLRAFLVRYDDILRRLDKYLDSLKQFLSDKEIYEGIVNIEKIKEFRKIDDVVVSSLLQIITGYARKPHHWYIICELDPKIQEKLNEIDKKIDLLNKATDKIFGIRDSFVDIQYDIRNELRERIKHGLYDELLIEHFLKV